MSVDALVVRDPVEQALTSAREMIEKIKLAMVKIYYIFDKEDIQKGIAQLPEVVRDVLKAGVEMVVKAIQTIIKGIETVHEKGYVVIALLKELPNVVDAVADLLDEAQAKSARLSAKIAAFTAVFVEEKFADVTLMLGLFNNLLKRVAGEKVEGYLPGVIFSLTEAQLGFDPSTGPTLAISAEAKRKALEEPGSAPAKPEDVEPQPEGA